VGIVFFHKFLEDEKVNVLSPMLHLLLFWFDVEALRNVDASSAEGRVLLDKRLQGIHFKYLSVDAELPVKLGENPASVFQGRNVQMASMVQLQQLAMDELEKDPYASFLASGLCKELIACWKSKKRAEVPEFKEAKLSAVLERAKLRGFRS
jgi:hypothetical protein